MLKPWWQYFCRARPCTVVLELKNDLFYSKSASSEQISILLLLHGSLILLPWCFNTATIPPSLLPQYSLPWNFTLSIFDLCQALIHRNVENFMHPRIFWLYYIEIMNYLEPKSQQSQSQFHQSFYNCNKFLQPFSLFYFQNLISSLFLKIILHIHLHFHPVMKGVLDYKALDCSLELDLRNYWLNHRIAGLLESPKVPWNWNRKCAINLVHKNVPRSIKMPSIINYSI